MPSSAQTVAASGMVNGQGTAPSQDMNAEFAKNNSKPIITVINQIYLFDQYTFIPNRFRNL
jgi:hypothetical protein